MAKVTVFQYNVFDAQNGCKHRARRWATRQAIDFMDGEIDESTAVQVDEKHVRTGGAMDGISSLDFDPHSSNE